jgi:hypothetical protein
MQAPVKKAHSVEYRRRIALESLAGCTFCALALLIYADVCLPYHKFREHQRQVKKVSVLGKNWPAVQSELTHIGYRVIEQEAGLSGAKRYLVEWHPALVSHISQLAFYLSWRINKTGWYTRYWPTWATFPVVSVTSGTISNLEMN